MLPCCHDILGRVLGRRQGDLDRGAALASHALEMAWQAVSTLELPDVHPGGSATVLAGMKH